MKNIYLLLVVFSLTGCGATNVEIVETHKYCERNGMSTDVQVSVVWQLRKVTCVPKSRWNQ